MYQLVKERVPAVMGFRWEVGDAQARDYAERFYKYLLESQQRSLENACLSAKKDLFAAKPADPIWASPVLVMQRSS